MAMSLCLSSCHCVMPSYVPRRPLSLSSYCGIGHECVVVVVMLAWTHGCLCCRRAGVVMRVTLLLLCWHGYVGALIIVMLEWICRYPPHASMDMQASSSTCWRGHVGVFIIDVLAWTCECPRHCHAGVDARLSSSLSSWCGHAVVRV